MKLLEPLTGDDRPFRFTAMEFIGMLYENEGNHDKALKYLDMIINKEVSKTLKRRVTFARRRF
ncbi:MAG: hypothetical protein LBB12_03085 [Holosporaceae bacterium]|jgi:hypothetical protein|nr:hypothetical protein [Holosporaceae bacterium]